MLYRNTRARRLRFEPLEERSLLAVFNVVPSVETAADGGAEDDIAIWIHPTDISLSRIIGTVKDSANALRVYNLAGQPIQSVSVPQVNNVDLRYNFPLGGQKVALVTGSNRADDSIVIYAVHPQTGMLQNVAARTISAVSSIYGCAMYVSPVSGKYYTFVSSESGQVQQWELFDNGAGKVDAMLVRSFAVGSTTEGLVADDELGYFYAGQESTGIWRYSAEPTGGTTRTQVDSTGAGGHLTADVEGLTIYYSSGGAGYLIASSQGSDEFAVYNRGGSNTYIGSFKLIAGGGIDAVADTDGIDVTNVPLGSQFPQGLFIAQDNDDNFKFVRWDAIETAFNGLLSTNTTWDPRLVGAVPELYGNYNGDSAVDVADFTVWRDTLGAVLQRYQGADGSGNGVIDDADYDLWKEQFGEELGMGGGTSETSLAAPSQTDALDATPAPPVPIAAGASGKARLRVDRGASLSVARSDVALLQWFTVHSRDDRDGRVRQTATTLNSSDFAPATSKYGRAALDEVFATLEPAVPAIASAALGRPDL